MIGVYCNFTSENIMRKSVILKKEENGEFFGPNPKLGFAQSDPKMQLKRGSAILILQKPLKAVLWQG